MAPMSVMAYAMMAYAPCRFYCRFYCRPAGPWNARLPRSPRGYRAVRAVTAHSKAEATPLPPQGRTPAGPWNARLPRSPRGYRAVRAVTAHSKAEAHPLAPPRAPCLACGCGGRGGWSMVCGPSTDLGPWTVVHGKREKGKGRADNFPWF